MSNHKLQIFIGVLFCVNVLSQDKITLNHADSLIGKVENGEQIREAIGNVSLVHNNVSINCNRVVQYFNQNKAELFGNVKVVKDTVTILAPVGTYYGNEAKVICPTGATLIDPSNTLKANYGIYFFNQDLANFRGNVRITDNKSYTITSDELDYYRSIDKSFGRGNVTIKTDSSTITSDNLVYERRIGYSVANGNVKIESDSTIVTADKGTYYEREKKSIGEGNVKIIFLADNATFFGDYSENFERTNYSFIRGNAELIQIEQKNNVPDTLFIYSTSMESFRNIPEHYIAKDSVKIIRSDYSSSSGIAFYNRNEFGKGGNINLSKDPVVWKSDMQISGDSIYGFFKDNLEDIYVYKSAFALQNKDEKKYDQMSGVFMHLNFLNDEIKKVRVDTNANSVYFVFEDSKLSGANKSKGEIIEIFFKDKEVVKVKIINSPEGTYYPKKLMSDSELTLPGFRIRNDKPVRKQRFN